MRTFFIILAACLISALIVKPSVGKEPSTGLMEYPGVVALSQESGKWIYKSFPRFLPLYVFEGDPPGQSRCDHVCISVWPILEATDQDTPKGSWTIIARDDGRKQWAYKNHPVYTFYEDSPGDAKGIGREEGWYLDPSQVSTDVAATKVVATKPSGKPTWQLLEP
jgi:predicted lipoprotein with Yx(FWY)xxD motif